MRKVSVAEHYDRLIAEENDPVHDPEPLRVYMNQWDGETFLRALELNGTQSVLEVGVGTGRLALQVLPRCKCLTGVDCSPETVRRAQKNLAAFANVQILCADFLEAVLPGNYDRVYSSLTFFHIPEKFTALQKMFDLLTPGGKLVLSISKEQATELVFPDRQLPLFPDQPETIRAWMEEIGFRNIETQETEFAWILSARKPMKET